MSNLETERADSPDLSRQSMSWRCKVNVLLALATLLPATVVVAGQQAATITSAHASVTVKGHVLNGAFTFDRLGDLTLWGPGGGVIDVGSDQGGTFQYSALSHTGKFKTTAATPLVVPVGVGPEVKVVTSNAGECTVTMTRADETGVSGSFECGRVTVMGPENKILGAIDGMTGTFTASTTAKTGA